MNLYRYASAQTFFPLAGKMMPWFAAAAVLLALAGLAVGFLIAPTDFQQGEVYRIIFIHVPSAWMAMFIYLVMAGYAVLTLVLRARLSAMMTLALAPTGALMAAIALWTGALWGKPTWGTYWAWDARMTSTLVLLFLYLGYLALVSAIEDPQRADRAGAVLVLVGVVNVPIIYFSVNWWNTLHQGASVSVTGGSPDGDHHAARYAAHDLCSLVLLHRRQPAPGTLDHSRTRRAQHLGASAGQQGSLLAAGGQAGMNHWQMIAIAYGLSFGALALEIALLVRRRRAALREALADDGQAVPNEAGEVI